MLITAADVVNTAADSAQLVPMLEESEEMTGVRVPVTLADGGYHTAKNLEAGARRGDVFVMPERYHLGARVHTSKTASSMTPRRTAMCALKANGSPFAGYAGTTARCRDPFVYTALREPCVAYAQPTGYVPRIGTRDALCGSGPPILYSVSIGNG